MSQQAVHEERVFEGLEIVRLGEKCRQVPQRAQDAHLQAELEAGALARMEQLTTHFQSDFLTHGVVALDIFILKRNLTFVVLVLIFFEVRTDKLV